MNEEAMVRTILFGGINMGLLEDEEDFRKMLECAYGIGKENEKETKRYIMNLIKEWIEEPMICFENLTAEQITFKGKKLEEYTCYQLVKELETIYKCRIDSLNTEKVKDKAKIMALQEEVSEKNKELESVNKTVLELETENFNLRRQIDMLKRINDLQAKSIDLSPLKGKLKVTPYVPAKCEIKEELEKLNKEEDCKSENGFLILLIFLYMMFMPARKDKVYLESFSLPKEIEDLIRGEK